MRVVLKFETGAYAGRMILLQSGQWINVGRTERADYSVPHDDLMSGLHFRIECQNQKCRVRDLDSTNGTRVNDARIVETDLCHGDRVSAGRSTFLVSIEQADPVSDRLVLPSTPPKIGSTPQENVGAVETPAIANEPSLESAPRIAAPETSPASALLSAIDSIYPFAVGLQDPDAAVRHEAFMAATWTGQKWLLEYCRCRAESPVVEHADALHLLAILGHPTDLSRILNIGRTKPLGPRRFEILAAFGHPGVVRDLLVEMESPDPATSVAAGLAFAKVTGFDATSEPSPASPAEKESPAENDTPADDDGPDEDAEPEADEIARPNAKAAEQHWNQVRDRFAKGVRWRRGIEISRTVESPALESLDLEARYEILLRDRFEGRNIDDSNAGP